MSYKTLLSDQDLFDAFQRGDERAFAQIYQAFKRPVYVTTFRMVGSAEDAEDLTVQVFARVWERRATIESMAHLKNFLFVAARNGSINFLEAKRRSPVELTALVTEDMETDGAAPPDADQLFADLVEKIMAIVEEMPRLRKLVFRMRYLDERPVKEVAEILELSIHSVYWHSKEALAQIRTALLEKAPARSVSLLVLALLAGSRFVHALF
ncbi:MAG TPA: sigma-70 family RNA polymerase sigma factor [Puia sp.]|nr:sigma-70 family RNA polymerase sigma factor [Puia sp.]